MNAYIANATLGISVDAQLRQLAVIQSLVKEEKEKKKGFYHFSAAAMDDRWTKLRAIFEAVSFSHAVVLVVLVICCLLCAASTEVTTTSILVF